MSKIIIPKRIGKKLDAFSGRKIAARVFLCFGISGVVLYFLIFFPLQQKIEAGTAARDGLTRQISRLALEQQLQLQQMPTRSDLPEVLDDLRSSFESRNVRVREMQVSGFSAAGGSGFTEASVKVKVTAGCDTALRAISEIQKSAGYPLIVREADFAENNAEYNFKVLLRSPN